MVSSYFTPKTQPQSIAPKTTTTTTKAPTTFETFVKTPNQSIAPTKTQQSVAPKVVRRTGSGTPSTPPSTATTFETFVTAPTQSVTPPKVTQSVAPTATKISATLTSSTSAKSPSVFEEYAGSKQQQQSFEKQAQIKNLGRKIAEYNNNVDVFRRQSAITRDAAFEKQLEAQKANLIAELDSRPEVTVKDGVYNFSGAAYLGVSKLSDFDRSKEIKIVETPAKQTLYELPSGKFTSDKAFAERVKAIESGKQEVQKVATERAKEEEQKVFNRFLYKSNQGFTKRTLQGDIVREALAKNAAEKELKRSIDVSSNIAANLGNVPYTDLDKFQVIADKLKPNEVRIAGVKEPLSTTETSVGSLAAFVAAEQAAKKLATQAPSIEKPSSFMQYVSATPKEAEKVFTGQVTYPSRPKAVMSLAKDERSFLDKWQEQVVQAGYKGGVKNTLYAAASSVPLTALSTGKTVVEGAAGLALMLGSGGIKFGKSLVSKGIIQTGKETLTSAAQTGLAVANVGSKFLSTGGGFDIGSRTAAKAITIKPFTTTGTVLGTLAPLGVASMSGWQKDIDVALNAVGKTKSIGVKSFSTKAADITIEKFKYQNKGGETLFKEVKRTMPKGATVGKIEQTITDGNKVLDFASTALKQSKKVEKLNEFKYGFTVAEKYKFPHTAAVNVETKGTIDVLRAAEKNKMFKSGGIFRGEKLPGTSASDKLKLAYTIKGETRTGPEILRSEKYLDSSFKGVVSGEYQKNAFASKKLLLAEEAVTQAAPTRKGSSISFSRRSLFRGKKGSLAMPSSTSTGFGEDLAGRWTGITNEPATLPTEIKIPKFVKRSKPVIRKTSSTGSAVITRSKVVSQLQTAPKRSFKTVSLNVGKALPTFTQAATTGRNMGKALLITSALSKSKYLSAAKSTVSSQLASAGKFKSLAQSIAKPAYESGYKTGSPVVTMPKVATIYTPKTVTVPKTSVGSISTFTPSTPTPVVPSTSSINTPIPAFPNFGQFKEGFGQKKWGMKQKTKGKINTRFVANLFEKLVKRK